VDARERLHQGRLVGIVTESDLLGKLVEGRASLSSTVAEVMMRRVTTVTLADDASALRQLFAEGLVGIVVDDSQRVLGVVTKMDLVDLLTSSLDSSLEEHAARREPAHS
jgi:cystathionine beta-synthase